MLLSIVILNEVKNLVSFGLRFYRRSFIRRLGGVTCLYLALGFTRGCLAVAGLSSVASAKEGTATLFVIPAKAGIYIS